MKQRNIFSSKNPPTSWIRNPNHFLKNFDLSGIATYVDIGASADKAKKSAILISDKHILFAQHSIGGSGLSFDVKFVNNNNQTFTYTVANTSAILNTDISIGVLSTAVDSSLCFYKSMRANFQNFYNTVLDPVGSGLEMPAIFIDQDKNISVGDCILKKYNSSPYPWIWDLRASQNSQKYNYCEGTITGDSGNGVFAILDNQLILLGTLFSSVTGSRNKPVAGTSLSICPAIHEYITEINSAMTSLAGSSYSITQINQPFNLYYDLKKPSIRINTQLYKQFVSSYNRSPSVTGYGENNKNIILDRDNLIFGPYSLNADLSYLLNPSVALSLNSIVAKTNNAGDYSLPSPSIAYKAMNVLAPVLNSINNTTNKRPLISGSWTQIELPTYAEDIWIDLYDNNTIFTTLGDIILSNVNSKLNFTFSYLPTSDLDIGSHTIKCKAYYYDGTTKNNISSFSNSITFDVTDSGGS